MTRSLGQPVVVENKTGAGGTIAATYTMRAAPDGYTFLIHHNGMATAPALYRKLPYNPLTDFEYVSQVIDVPMTLVGRKDLPAKDFNELRAYLKANGDKVNLAHAGLGAVSHLCGVLFRQATGADVTTVPYQGTGPAMNALLAGQVDLLCDQTTSTTQHIKAGAVKLYRRHDSAARMKTLPDAPTLAEQGLKGFEVVVWHGIYAPKGTPKEAIDKFGAALRDCAEGPGSRAAAERPGRRHRAGGQAIPGRSADLAGAGNRSLLARYQGRGTVRRLSDQPMPATITSNTSLALARTLLFVPGNRPERFQKALNSGADAVVLDLEDSVPLSAKQSAREAIRDSWSDLQAGGPALVVRINAADLDLGLEDLEWLARLNPPAGVMVPKVESVVTLNRVSASLRGVPILPLIESAAGHAALTDIAAAANVLRLVVGHIDFMADSGLQCSNDEHELTPLRFAVAMATRLHRLAAAVDGVTVAIDDDDRLRDDTRRALRFGFGGKLCIHPRQVPLVHDALSPTAEERRVGAARDCRGR